MEDYKIPLSIASCSVGFGTNLSLAKKLEAISRAGFDGIELAFPDLVAYAGELAGREIDETKHADQEDLLSTARRVRTLCKQLGLTVMMLQPFSHFEGWPDGSRERRDALERAEQWIRVMRDVGTDMLQVGSSDATGISPNKQLLAKDLGQLADMLAPYGFRVAYENWCWATCTPTWSLVWEIVDMARRPNLGLCLDTFQTAAGEWGDPTTASGRVEGVSAQDLQRMYEMSLQTLAATVPKDKIYVVQVSDAYRMMKPLRNGLYGNGQRPRAHWSHAFRPMPYDGGYLPILPMATAVLKTGFRGWFSLEVFDGGHSGEGKQTDMGGFAERGIGSLRRLVQEASSE